MMSIKCLHYLTFQLIHGVIDGECRLSQPSYVDFSKIWSLDEWWIVSDTTRNLVREFSRDNLSKDEVSCHELLINYYKVSAGKNLIFCNPPLVVISKGRLGSYKLSSAS